MSISHGDQLFVYYEEDKIPAHGRYSYFGSNFGSVVGFIQYIDGYVLAVTSLYDKYISCEEYRMDILDTIIYPLCFNYRQIVELYIKYLFFKYSNTSDAEKETFVKQVNHKLNRAWTETRPHIQRLLQKIDNPIDITLFDDFINQIDTFDTDSFRMRYPIKKDLSSVHVSPVKLDVVGLHQKMIDLFNLFRRLDAEIDCVLTNNVCSDGFTDLICALYCDGKADIIAILEPLRHLASKVKKHRLEKLDSSNGNIDISDIDLTPDPEQDAFEQMVLQLPAKHAAILALLTHAGGNIVDGRCRLAINEEERTKDFFKLLEITLKECSAFINLEGKFPCSEMCYALLEKSAEVTLRWLETSILIMESCI